MTTSTQFPLASYLTRFASLNRAPNARLGRAPHKPVLLLTLLDAVDYRVEAHR